MHRDSTRRRQQPGVHARRIDQVEIARGHAFIDDHDDIPRARHRPRRQRHRPPLAVARQLLTRREREIGKRGERTGQAARTFAAAHEQHPRQQQECAQRHRHPARIEAPGAARREPNRKEQGQCDQDLRANPNAVLGHRIAGEPGRTDQVEEAVIGQVIAQDPFARPDERGGGEQQYADRPAQQVRCQPRCDPQSANEPGVETGEHDKPGRRAERDHPIGETSAIGNQIEDEQRFLDRRALKPLHHIPPTRAG
jgi:hypothetical protein